MTEQIRILLQTTIPPTVQDWSIARFSMLREILATLRGPSGHPLYAVTARDRDQLGAPDSVLSRLDQSSYDQLWLFAVDTGNGLTEDDCAGISRFRKSGGGMLVTRDHMDLGSSVCGLGGVGAAHFFHSRNLDPDPVRHQIDDPYTTYISWPNYHSGANGDFQEIEVEGEGHPVLKGVRFLPSHPHEGAVGAPAGDPSARVIAIGRSTVTGRPFNIAVAFEPSEAGGPAIAQSTFHHFADYNLDPANGCPGFVTESPGGALPKTPEARWSVERYFGNVAAWLGSRAR